MVVACIVVSCREHRPPVRVSIGKAIRATRVAHVHINTSCACTQIWCPDCLFLRDLEPAGLHEAGVTHDHCLLMCLFMEAPRNQLCGMLTTYVMLMTFERVWAAGRFDVVVRGLFAVPQRTASSNSQQLTGHVFVPVGGTSVRNVPKRGGTFVAKKGYSPNLL